MLPRPASLAFGCASPPLLSLGGGSRLHSPATSCIRMETGRGVGAEGGSKHRRGAVKSVARGFMAAAMLSAALSLQGVPEGIQPASAEIILDENGVPKQRVAYFPCYQEGQFCFRPIYCEGKFSPEGALNASIIFAGILGPVYSIWRRKAGLDPDPNTPEGQEYYRQRWKIKEKERAAKPKVLSRYFGKKPADPAGNAEKND